jgi:ankyrin repeat protein
VDIAAHLIKNGADVNGRVSARHDWSGSTPLHFAAWEGHVAVVELLIDARAQVNVHAAWGHTPLEYAASAGHKDVVELLLARGADIEAGDDWNRTALLAALHKNHPEIVKLLLNRGANVEARLKPRGVTALHLAVQQNAIEVAKLLFKAGAYVDCKDYHDSAPLHWAIRDGKQDMVELLLDYGAGPWRQRGVNLVGLAMLSKQNEMVKFLVDKGFEHSAVHLAAFFGDLDEVKRYLAAGGDVNALDQSRLTLLICAISGRHTEEIEFLISKGADVNLKGAEGWTALHRAAVYGYTEIVRMLLDRGADMTIRTEFYGYDEGWTPLHRACLAMNPTWHRKYKDVKAVVELLVANGADVNAKTKNGRTPLSLLRWGGYEENEQTAELLRQHGAKE